MIELLEDKGLLSEIGIKPGHARTMKARGSIPAHWDKPIVDAARAHGLPVDFELLAGLRAREIAAEGAGA